MNGIKTDFVNNRIVISKKAYNRSQHSETSEYRSLRALKKEFPEMEVVIRQTTRKPKSKRIKYDKMLNYILCQNNSEALLKEFIEIRNRSKSQDNAYKYVADWFENKFPDFKKYPVFNDKGDVIQTPA